MHNELFSIGPVTVYGYGTMIAIGVVAALLVTETRLRRAKLRYDLVYELLVWALVGGFLGSKVLYDIVEFPTLIQNPVQFLDFTNGFVVYGGIIGGVFAGFLFTKVHHLSFWCYMDYVMPSIILAQAFGRIGCFLAGCCYGKETESAFSIVFTNSQYAPNDVKLIPTQLISSAWDFLTFFVLVLIQNKKLFKKEGNVAACYFLIYGCGRFVIEFFRGDNRGTVGILSTSQFISIFIVLFGILILATSRLRADISREGVEQPDDEDGRKIHLDKNL